MKPILLLLLLTCLPLCAATTYPMLSTTTNRTVTGGVTNMSLLNANQTFTGTNTFALAPKMPGYRRLLYVAPTNSYIASFAVSASVLTNSGDFALMTPIYQVTIPALLSTNSYVVIQAMPFVRTNANTTAANLVCFVGTNTNAVLYSVGTVAATVGVARFTADLLYNNNSFSSHIANPAGSGSLSFLYPSNFVGSTASPWTLYVGGYTATSCTNINFRTLIIEEISQ